MPRFEAQQQGREGLGSCNNTVQGRWACPPPSRGPGVPLHAPGNALICNAGCVQVAADGQPGLCVPAQRAGRAERLLLHRRAIHVRDVRLRALRMILHARVFKLCTALCCLPFV